MAQVTNTDTLYTRVRNNSGGTRVFGYLNDGGMRLIADEVVVVRGDLLAKLGAQRSPRQFRALERDLLAGIIVIEQTPPPVMYDTVDDVPKLLALQNGVLGLVDPSWDESGSSVFAGG